MNTRTRIAAILFAALLALMGCGGKEAAQPTPKPGVVYLDPNATPVPTATPAPKTETTEVPAGPEQTPAEETVAEAEETEAPLDLYFACRGVRIEPWMEAAPVLAALGEPIRSFEADSCAYVGKDLIYAYPGMELTVNEIDGVERITLIIVADDTVTIPQGLRIYDEEEKLLSILGGTEENGVYTYRSGQVQLIIQVKDAGDDTRRIAYIEYRIAEDQ